MRKPFYVDAVRVTDENMEDVAEWCQGDVRQTNPKGDVPPQNFVKVRVLRPLNERQCMAYSGDWVLYAGTGYKVYSDKAFKQSFVAEQPLWVTTTALEEEASGWADDAVRLGFLRAAREPNGPVKPKVTPATTPHSVMSPRPVDPRLL
jgi:hypothetical protein